MRVVRFASLVALYLAAVATTGDAANVDIGAITKKYGSFNWLRARGLKYASDGSLYITDNYYNKVYRQAPGANSVTAFVSNGATNTGMTDVAFSPDESTMYLLEWQEGRLRSVAMSNPTGAKTTITSGMGYCWSVDVMQSNGNAYIGSNGQGKVFRVTGLGAGQTPSRGTQASISTTLGVAVKQDEDRIFSTASGYSSAGIFEVTSGVTRLISNGNMLDGAGLSARTRSASMAAISRDHKYMYFRDDQKIRRINLISGNYEVDTLINAANADAGTARGVGNAVSYLATFSRPEAIAFSFDQTEVAYTMPREVWRSNFVSDLVPPASPLPSGFVAAARATVLVAGDFDDALTNNPQQVVHAVQTDIALLVGTATQNVFVANIYSGSLVVDVAIDAAAGITTETLNSNLNAVAADPTLLPNTAALLGQPLTTVSIEEIETAAPGVVTPACSCDSEKLAAVYTSDAIPDATAEAEVNISLDTDNWEVVFQIRNVRAISNGHVIASGVDTQQLAAAAFTPYVAGFSASALWTPPACGLGFLDTPADSLKVAASWDNAACRTTYEMRYSLVDPAVRDEQHCDLTDDNAGTIKVNCSIVLSSVRAFDATEPEAFLAQEAAFAAEISLGSQLNNEVADLLHATLAKCSVKNGPLYVVDCRVPGDWDFQSTFQVVQEPAGWINAASCASTKTATATFIRCDIENDAPIENVAVARANLTATPDATTTNPMTFDIEFIVPRRISTFTSASLASFIENIAMADGKFYYGTADKATLHIDVFDSSRLTMTALELFNSATPSKEVMDLFPGTSDARFQTAINANPTRFVVDFYPAAIRENSRFYRFGPHGINISFTFAAARRVTGGGTGARAEEGGYAVVDGLRVEGSEGDSGSTLGAAFATGSAGAVGAAVAVAAVVATVGLLGAAVVTLRRNKKAEEKAESAVEL